MEDTLFNELINSVKEAGQILRGEQEPSQIKGYSDVFGEAQKNPEYKTYMKQHRKKLRKNKSK